MRERKPKSSLGSRPKINIKGKLKAIIALLIMINLTIPVFVRFYGMFTYNWGERGDYFMMGTHIPLLYLLPGEFEGEVVNGGAWSDDHARYEIVSDEFKISGICDTSLYRCLRYGYPTKYSGITCFEYQGVEVDIWDDEFKFSEESQYSDEEKEKVIDKCKKVFIILSVIETIIIVIRLAIHFDLIRRITKYIINSVKEDLQGIEPI